MRRRILPLLLLAVALLGSACSTPPQPRVSAFSGERTVRVAPLQYCSVQGTGCTQDGAAAGRLLAAGGDPVQLSVDGDIADAPWRVEYRVVGDDGDLSVACSPLFAPGTRYSYTVRPPRGGRLQMVNVYQLGARITAGGAGIQFGVRGTWTVLTAPRAPLPKPGEALCPDVS